MIKPDDIDVFNDNDKATMAKLEEVIDAALKATRGGPYVVPMAPSFPQTREFAALKDIKGADQRIWVALAKRYMEAGWAVTWAPGTRGAERFHKMCIMHPQIVVPESIREFLGLEQV